MIYGKEQYESKEFRIGLDFNEDGEPIVVVGGEPIGPVAYWRSLLEDYEQRAGAPFHWDDVRGAVTANLTVDTIALADGINEMKEWLRCGRCVTRDEVQHMIVAAISALEGRRRAADWSEAANRRI